MQDQEMKAMLIEYMGKGFLENIIAMFRQDRTLNRFIPDMLAHDELQVRIGTVALVEDLVKENDHGLEAAVPGLILLLQHENPTIRGDAVSVLGIIRDRSSVYAIESCLQDDHPMVRGAAAEILQEIKRVRND